MRSMLVLAFLLGICQPAAAQHIGWQATFDEPGFGNGKYTPVFAKGMAHYMLGNGYFANIQQEFAPLAIADFPFFGIRARDVRGGIFVKFRIDDQWQKRWIVAAWKPQELGTRYVDLRQYGKSISGVWLNSQSDTDGAEWFLDWMGLMRSDNPLNVKILHPGALAKLPDHRALVFTLANGLDTEAEVVCTVAGPPPAYQKQASETRRLRPGQKARITLPTASEPGSKYRLSITDGKTGSIYHQALLTVPPVLESRMRIPSYRNTIYATQNLSAIELDCRANVLPPLLGELALSAGLFQGERLVRQLPPAPPQARLAIPVNALAVGEYAVVLELTHQGHRLAQTRMPLHVRAPHANEMRIDEHLNLLINGQPFLPVGLYSVPTQHLQLVAEAGFNSVLTYSSSTTQLKAYLDEAARVGLKAIVHSPGMWFGKGGEAKLRQAVGTLKDHPALLGWYLIDEPSTDRKGAAPADLARLYALMQELDPYHPTFTVYCRPVEFAAYKDTHDIFMCDPYPVGNGPLSFVAEWTELGKTAMRGEKPVHVVPQSFGSEKGPQVQWRIPTAAEEICMGYLALAHGAKALFYYRFDVQQYDKAKADLGKWPWPTIGYLPELRPKTWAGLVKMGGQMKRLAPIILSPEPKAKITVSPYEPALHVALREYRGTRYLFAVNPHEEPIEATITVAGLTTKVAHRLAEGSAGPAAGAVAEQDLPVTDGAFRDRFDKLAVHIYRFE
jgi:hypothetical protein